MTVRPSLAVVLAAGKGTRMKSHLPKVLHPLAGRALVTHVLTVARDAGLGRTALVIGPDMAPVEQAARARHPDVEAFVQREQLGTAHAVLAARAALQGFEGDIVILYGDTPLLRPETVQRLRERLEAGADVAVLGFEASDPSGYGRLITAPDGALLAIREDKDASPEERRITLCNSGVFGFRGAGVLTLLDGIGNDNAKGEYYLTDAVEIARAAGKSVVAVSCAEEEVQGVNSRSQLAQAEAALQDKFRAKAMEDGATLIAPETV